LAVHGGPRFLQTADALQAAVVDGSLKPGDRLPPQCQLAAQLDVDLTTITRAYGEARRRILVALRSFALMVAPLTAALATQWILDGSADGLMECVRNEARLRHRMARDILAGRYSGAGDGLHVWLELPAYWNSSQLARAADSEGIAVTPAEAFATGSGSVNAIRISLGSIKDRGRLQAGLQRLSHLLARRPESFSAAVV
jgi:DNA-binding transcriptional MocR family regulator